MPTLKRTLEYKRLSGQSWRGVVADGVRLKRAGDRTWSQTMMAANTPTLLRAGLVEGDTEAGMLASGQVVAMIEDLPSSEELVDRIVTGAVAQLRASAAAMVDTAT